MRGGTGASHCAYLELLFLSGGAGGHYQRSSDNRLIKKIHTVITQEYRQDQAEGANPVGGNLFPNTPVHAPKFCTASPTPSRINPVPRDAVPIKGMSSRPAVSPAQAEGANPVGGNLFPNRPVHAPKFCAASPTPSRMNPVPRDAVPIKGMSSRPAICPAQAEGANPVGGNLFPNTPVHAPKFCTASPTPSRINPVPRDAVPIKGMSSRPAVSPDQAEGANPVGGNLFPNRPVHAPKFCAASPTPSRMNPVPRDMASPN
jgi:hypothetical protein